MARIRVDRKAFSRMDYNKPVTAGQYSGSAGNPVMDHRVRVHL